MRPQSVSEAEHRQSLPTSDVGRRPGANTPDETGAAALLEANTPAILPALLQATALQALLLAAFCGGGTPPCPGPATAGLQSGLTNLTCKLEGLVRATRILVAGPGFAGLMILICLLHELWLLESATIRTTPLVLAKTCLL